MIIKQDEEILHDELTVLSFSEAVENHMRDGKFETYLSCIVDLASELDIDDKQVVKLDWKQRQTVFSSNKKLQ